MMKKEDGTSVDNFLKNGLYISELDKIVKKVIS
jgi:hypothetical protein